MTLAHSISRFFLFIIYVTSVESWFATPTASGYHGTLVFNGLEQVWAGTDLGLEEHAYLGDSFQSLVLCDLRDVRIGLCDGFGRVCKTIRSVLCYLSGFFCTPTSLTRHYSCAHIDQATQLKSPNFEIVREISSWPRCIQNFILKKNPKACIPVEWIFSEFCITMILTWAVLVVRC